jgi:dihydrofolate reductase
MRKVVLYIAMSLDGYVADKEGGVEWLGGHSDEGDDQESYETFVKEVDTVILGWNTYRQVTEELSPDQWVYENLTSYVITHRDCEDKDNIFFVNETPESLVRALREKEGKDIWICGGASIVQQLVRADLIDEYDISVIPVILGGGLRLFEEIGCERKLWLKGTKTYNGIAELIYERRKETEEFHP